LRDELSTDQVVSTYLEACQQRMEAGKTMRIKQLELNGMDAPVVFQDIHAISIAKALAVLVVFVFGFRPMGGFAQTLDEKQAAIKQQLGKIPMGKAIEVRLLQKGRPKITGILLAVEEDSFKIKAPTRVSFLMSKLRSARSSRLEDQRCGGYTKY
jgi:hypothetical protein